MADEDLEVSARLSFFEFLLETQLGFALASHPNGQQELAAYRSDIVMLLGRTRRSPEMSEEDFDEFSVQLRTIAERFFDKVEFRRAQGPTKR